MASQVPGVPLLTCPALRPRWDSRTLTLRMTVGVGLHCFRRLSPSCRCRSPLRSHYPGASRCAHAAFRLAYDVGSHTCAFRGSITRPVRSLSTLRGFPSSTSESYSHARLASGWWSTFAGRDFHPSGTTERFQNSSTFHSPFPGLAWRKCTCVKAEITPLSAPRGPRRSGYLPREQAPLGRELPPRRALARPAGHRA